MVIQKKIKLNALIITILAYSLLFFCFNFYYTELWTALTRKGYYFTYTLLEYLFFSFILFQIIKENTFRKIIIAGSILFTAFMILNFITSTIKRIDSVPIGVETILLFVYIFYFFYSSLKKIDNNKLYIEPRFWFVTGMLVYLGSTFFFNILAESVDSNFMINYWHFTFFGDILKNILFTIGILLYLNKSDKNKEKEKTIDDLLSI